LIPPFQRGCPSPDATFQFVKEQWAIYRGCGGISKVSIKETEIHGTNNDNFLFQDVRQNRSSKNFENSNNFFSEMFAKIDNQRILRRANMMLRTT
jgi:hypothetical protein